jgi:hypothetical protein
MGVTAAVKVLAGYRRACSEEIQRCLLRIERPSSGALEHPGQQSLGVDIESTGNGDELSHIDTTLERFDALDPVGRDPKLSG